MTLRIKILVPADGGHYEAHVTVGTMNFFLTPGESVDAYVYKGQEVHVVEVPEGTKAKAAQEALEKAEADLRTASGDLVPDATPITDSTTLATDDVGELPADLASGEAPADEQLAETPAVDPKPATRKR